MSVPEAAEPLELWMSAVDSVTSVLTIAGNLAPDELDQLRSSLERRYGRVNAKAQNSQWMMQWVRKGTMIRLTWRAQQGAKATSVALIDGNVLDAWTARRGTPQKGTAAAKKPATTKKTSHQAAGRHVGGPGYRALAGALAGELHQKASLALLQFERAHHLALCLQRPEQCAHPRAYRRATT